MRRWRGVGAAGEVAVHAGVRVLRPVVEALRAVAVGIPDNVGVTGYQIFRNGAIVNTSPGTSFTDTGLAGGTTYTYTVRARDAAGNASAASTAATGTTQPGGGGGNSGCTATYRTTNTWDGGFQGEVTVTNTGTAQTRGWSVALTLATGRTIGSLWNGTLTGTTVTNAGHNGALAPTASTNFGFVANGQSTNGVTVASCTTS